MFCILCPVFDLQVDRSHDQLNVLFQGQTVCYEANRFHSIINTVRYTRFFLVFLENTAEQTLAYNLQHFLYLHL